LQGLSQAAHIVHWICSLEVVLMWW
jgi:hypothetical protein